MEITAITLFSHLLLQLVAVAEVLLISLVVLADQVVVAVCMWELVVPERRGRVMREAMEAQIPQAVAAVAVLDRLVLLEIMRLETSAKEAMVLHPRLLALL